LYGSAFQREQTLSAAVYPGGDRVADGDGTRVWCELLDCLESSGALGGRAREVLKELGVDIDRFLGCLRERCRQLGPSEGVKQASGETFGSLDPDRMRRLVDILAREFGTA
jgi:hypothetical protein